MDPPENELDIVKRKIAAIEVKLADTEVKLARAEAERDRKLIEVYAKQAMVYENRLAGLQEKENRLSQAAGELIDSNSCVTI